MCRRHAIHIEDFARGGLIPIEPRPIPARLARQIESISPIGHAIAICRPFAIGFVERRIAIDLRRIASLRRFFARRGLLRTIGMHNRAARSACAPRHGEHCHRDNTDANEFSYHRLWHGHIGIIAHGPLLGVDDAIDIEIAAIRSPNLTIIATHQQFIAIATGLKRIFLALYPSINT